MSGETRLVALRVVRSRRHLQLHRSRESRAAIHVDEQIADAARRLLDFPDSGRTGRVAGTRELVIPRTPYVAAYLIEGDTVRILRVLHGAQMWPDELTNDD
jgi:toxin ParE1/3/4